MSSSSSFIARNDLKNFKRILVKVGTSVVIHSDGSVALGRLGHLVEQISHVMKAGKQVVVVTSGAVGVGRLKIGHNALLSLPLRSHVLGATRSTSEDSRSAAAAGQSSLMALYELLFANKQISCAQVLLTDADFGDAERRANLRNTLNHLLDYSILPILNENDVISTRRTPLRDEKEKIFWDNDSLAALIGAEMQCELLVLLSDVDGLYRVPPDPNRPHQQLEVIHTYNPDVSSFTIGDKSRIGRGGMQAKVEACLNAIRSGVKAVVIASGYQDNVVRRVLDGERLGTIFVAQPNEFTSADHETRQFERLVHAARDASRQLQQLSADERSRALQSVAAHLLEHSEEILAANRSDLEHARTANLAEALRARLQLSKEKLRQLAQGIRQLATAPDPIGRVLSRTELAPSLVLSREQVPIGVLLVIFEARPDVLPQVAALALRSGNALLLKGGKEASFTNAALHRVLTHALAESTRGRVSNAVLSLVESRDAVAHLLRLPPPLGVDLVIPRGSAQLVRDIQAISRVPVLGHSDGICHVFVHRAANIDKAVRILLDSKCDYPAACNSVECLLLHSELSDADCLRLLRELRAAKVQLFGGPKAVTRFKELDLPPARSLSIEYSDLMLNVELVDSLPEAVRFINKHSSAHTDAIVTEDAAAAEQFLAQVDSACVFHNSSTRFSDGYRFGLGAEVGISTGRVHARGPVGVEGLLTTRYQLRSTSQTGDVVSEFTRGERAFTHRPLAISAKL